MSIEIASVEGEYFAKNEHSHPGNEMGLYMINTDGNGNQWCPEVGCGWRVKLAQAGS